LSKENSTLVTNAKSDYIINTIASQWSANCGPQPNCGPSSTFYWAAQNVLLWAVA